MRVLLFIHNDNPIYKALGINNIAMYPIIGMFTKDGKLTAHCTVKDIDINKPFKLDNFITSSGEIKKMNEVLSQLELIQYIRRFPNEDAYLVRVERV